MVALISGGILAVVIGIIVFACLAISSKRERLKKEAHGKKRENEIIVLL